MTGTITFVTVVQRGLLVVYISIDGGNGINVILRPPPPKKNNEKVQNTVFCLDQSMATLNALNTVTKKGIFPFLQK